MQPLLGRVRLHAFSVALSCSEVFFVPPLLLHPHSDTAIIVLLQTGALCALLPLAAVSNHQYIHMLSFHINKYHNFNADCLGSLVCGI